LNALGQIASKLRTRLGESAATVAAFHPLAEATTPSLDALSYSLGLEDQMRGTCRHPILPGSGINDPRQRRMRRPDLCMALLVNRPCRRRTPARPTNCAIPVSGEVLHHGHLQLVGNRKPAKLSSPVRRGRRFTHRNDSSPTCRDLFIRRSAMNRRTKLPRFELDLTLLSGISPELWRSGCRPSGGS
jgi:hypothetical protein